MAVILLKNVAEAVRHFKKGDVVIFPTETAYGLGADATNVRAIGKIYRLKKRSRKKSLPVIVASFKMAERYVSFSSLAKKIASKYWPGALTIVLPLKKKVLPRLFYQTEKTLGLRVSSHTISQRLSRRLGRPIVSTSANKSGQDNIYTEKKIMKEFGAVKDSIYFLTGGTLPRRGPSTVVAIKGSELTILRQGKIKPHV